MKESYGEDIASRTGPESCVGGRKAAGEALAGVRTGWVVSRENTYYFRVPTISPSVEGNTDGVANAMTLPDPARSKTPRTCGNSMHRSWDIPRLAPADDDARVRAVNLLRVKRR